MENSWKSHYIIQSCLCSSFNNAKGLNTETKMLMVVNTCINSGCYDASFLYAYTEWNKAVPGQAVEIMKSLYINNYASWPNKYMWDNRSRVPRVMWTAIMCCVHMSIYIYPDLFL